jgi:hypothetical protein
MTADPAPDPMEQLLWDQELAILKAADILAKAWPQRTLRGETQTPEWQAYNQIVEAASKLPALRAAIEAMRAELAEWRTLHALVRPDTPAEKGSP